MQDFNAVLAESGPVFAEVRAQRLTGASRGLATAVTADREALPVLLDPRLVRAELTRLRGARGGPSPAERRRGA